MRKVLLVIPLMTFFADTAIFLDIPILREAIVFVFLSFIPGFAILRLFKLKEISYLDTILFSVALSITFVMFMALLVNQLFLFLGLSQPLSTAPLTITISAFTLTSFFIGHRRVLSETIRQKTSFKFELKRVLRISIIIFLLPCLSALGVLYHNVNLILLSCVIIAVLCVMSIVSRRLIPENFFPVLIFSISVGLVCQVPLLSKYLMGWDINLEYYFFRLTQINGHWIFLNPNVNSLTTINYNSMLSITLLPAVYSALMHAQDEIVFKILYPFILSLVPLTLYRIYEKQFGKLTGLLSTFFFVFTSATFFGAEILSLNRQIVGEFFLLLSVFLLISPNISVAKRRLLLITFGAALAVSHYTLAYIYLAIVALVFVISRVKHITNYKIDTITVLLLFGITFSWYALASAPLISLVYTIKGTITEFTTSVSSTSTTTASTMFAVPQAFTMASWINLLVLGIANLFLIIGVFVIILRSKGTGIFDQYRVISIGAAVILVVSLIVPRIAIILNFSRILGIALLFLSPCFVFGGQTFLRKIAEVGTKINRPLKQQSNLRSKNINIVFLLIAILLSAYFLSQVGFVNRVTNGSISNYYSTNFDRMIMSNESQVKINLYDSYIPEQDVYSASWLQSHKVETAEVFADSESGGHVLVSYGLIPNNLLVPITNTTIPQHGSFVYLGSLNIVNGVISTTTGLFNVSEISSLLNQNNLVYSNGNSEVQYVVPVQ
jgi:uncharacterized membrane protein